VTSRSSAYSLTNVEVVTFALWQLHGLDKAIHLEEIAVQAHRLAPGAFRWDLDKFASSVDKDKVRVSLTDAEKPERAFVASVGVTKHGAAKRTDYWRLTASGAAWALENETRLADSLAGPRPRIKRAAAGSVQAQIRKSDLFAEYERTGNVSRNEYSFADLVEVSPDASNEVVARRFDELKSRAMLIGEPMLVAFLEACSKAHVDMLVVGAP
jgi:hypothetical protein